MFAVLFRACLVGAKTSCVLLLLLVSGAHAVSSICPGTGVLPSISSRLDLNAATYLGTGATDSANDVAVAADCSLLLATRITGTDFGLTATTPLASLGVLSTGGAVLRVSTDGARALSVARMGAEVFAVAVHEGTGDVLVAGDFGVARLSPDMLTVRWFVRGAADRIRVGVNGTTVVLSGKVMRVYAVDGTSLSTRTFTDSLVADVAVDDAGTGNARVFVTGFAQRNGGSCSQLQVAWIRAYTTANVLAWTAYDWPTGVADVRSECADTRGRRLAMGEDGKLYFAGTSAGGNAIFRRSPTDLLMNATNATTDAYNTAYNTRSNHITYIARFNPVNGVHEIGTFLLTRLDSTAGNTIEPRAIAADASGRVTVGGFAAYAIAKRATLVMNGTTLAAYAGGDAWVLTLAADFFTRITWMVFNNGGKGTIFGLASTRGIVAAAGDATATPLFTTTALQASVVIGTDPASSAGYFSTWRSAIAAAPNRALLACGYDIDGDGLIGTDTDGLLLLRYATGVTGDALTANALGAAATRRDSAAVTAYIQAKLSAFDWDGDNKITATTDGSMLLRYMDGVRGAALVAGARNDVGTRRDFATIEAFVAAGCQ